MKDEERWDAFVFFDVIDRGIVAVFCWIVAEFFAVPPFGLRLGMHTSARLGSLDDGGNIVGIAIDRNTAFDDSER